MGCALVELIQSQTIRETAIRNNLHPIAVGVRGE